MTEGGEAIHRFCSVTAGRQALPESLKLYLVNIAIEKLDPQDRLGQQRLARL